VSRIQSYFFEKSHLILLIYIVQSDLSDFLLQDLTFLRASELTFTHTLPSYLIFLFPFVSFSFFYLSSRTLLIVGSNRLELQYSISFIHSLIFTSAPHLRRSCHFIFSFRCFSNISQTTSYTSSALLSYTKLFLCFICLHSLHLRSYKSFMLTIVFTELRTSKMPNWRSYDSSVRLLSAILAAHPELRLNYQGGFHYSSIYLLLDII
jgi:hypothetical protein